VFKKILVGYDGSEGGKAALAAAAVLAAKFESQMTVLCVRAPLPRHSDLPGEYEAEAEAANENFIERRLEVVEVAVRHGLSIPCETRHGHPAQAIVNHADEGGYDLIVVGHSGHSGIWRRLLGDTTDRIRDRARCNVLVVKAGT